MRPTQIMNSYYLIVALLEMDGGTVDVRAGDHRLVAGKSFGELDVRLTTTYKHKDGRMHRISEDVRLDIGLGTANKFFIWLSGAVERLEAVK